MRDIEMNVQKIDLNKKQPFSARLNGKLLLQGKARAKNLNRSFASYLETLIQNDVNLNL